MIRSMIAAVAVLSLTACSANFGVGEPMGDNGWNSACGVWVEDTIPLDGTVDAYYRSPIEFHLSSPDATAQVLAPVDGEQWTSVDGLTVFFEPSEPLAPNTDYDFALQTCGGQPNIGFRTSSYGEPVEFALKELVGITWQLGLDSGRFVEGGEIAEVAAAALGGDLLVHVLEVGPDNATVLRVGLGDATGQDRCARTLDLPPIDLSSAPDLRASSERMDIDAFSGTLPLYNVDIEATVAPDGSSLGGGRFTFTVDAKEIATGLGVGKAETLCEIAAGVGVPCGACPQSDNNTCVTLAADQIVALEAEDVLIERIDTVPDSCK